MRCRTSAGAPLCPASRFGGSARPDWLQAMPPGDFLPAPPRLPSQLERADIGGLAHDAAYTDVSLSGVVWSDQHADRVQLETVRLVDVDLSDSRVEQLSVTDAELTRCNLANVQGLGTKATRVAIDTSRLTGVALPEASLRDLTVQGCRVDLATFGFADLVRVTFEDCLMAETSFLDARLQCVRFRSCDLTRADFRGASMHGCEFRRSDLTDLEGVAHLRGSAIDWSGIVANADVWAATLGIKVLDSD